MLDIVLSPEIFVSYQASDTIITILLIALELFCISWCGKTMNKDKSTSTNA